MLQIPKFNAAFALLIAVVITGASLRLFAAHTIEGGLPSDFNAEIAEPKMSCWAKGLSPVSPLDNRHQLRQLTASPCTPAMVDFGDPSVPRLTFDHTISVYGSGLLTWHGKSDQDAWNQFLAGEIPNYSPILLHHPDGTPLADAAGQEEAWDVTVEDFSRASGDEFQSPILFGGVMLPPPGQTHAHFDQDNKNRRTYSFQLKNQKWTRNLEPLNELFPSTGWLGHNYGHQFITAKNGEIWMFYERVSEVLNDAPTKTEIFARRFTPPSTLTGPEIQIFRIPSNPFPAVVRTNGNLLAEGPRPFSVRIKHRTYYFVSFSSSDWGSDHYGINLLWSDTIDGPYQPILNPDGRDLKDFGAKIRADHALTYGPGRGSFFQDAKEHWWVIFHAATLEARLNLQASPNSPLEESMMRNFFVAPVRIRLKHGIPDLEILDRDKAFQ